MSKLRTNQIETLDGLNTKDVATLVDDIDTVQVTTATGTQALSGALDRRIIYVDTIADLQALPTSGLVNGQQVQVKEYNAGTGVGGGEFYWEATSTETENGGTVFGSDTEGRWKRFDKGFVTPEDFGAVGDGITDDLSAFLSLSSWLANGSTIKGLSSVYNVPQSSNNNGSPILSAAGLERLTFDFGNSRIVSSDDTNTSVPALIQLEDCTHVDVNVLDFERINVSQETTEHDGRVVFCIGNCNFITLNKKIGKKGSLHYGQSLFSANDGGSPLGSGVAGGHFEIYGYAHQSQYGVNLATSGNETYLDIDTFEVKRSFFPYGVKNITALINSQSATGADVNLSQLSSAGNKTLENVKVYLTSDDAYNPIRINIVGEDNSTIKNIDIWAIITNPRNRIFIDANNNGTEVGGVIENISFHYLKVDANYSATLSSNTPDFILFGSSSSNTIKNVHFKNCIATRMPSKMFNTNVNSRLKHLSVENFYFSGTEDAARLNLIDRLYLSDCYIRNESKDTTQQHLLLSDVDMPYLAHVECYGTITESSVTNITKSGVYQGTGNVR